MSCEMIKLLKFFEIFRLRKSEHGSVRRSYSIIPNRRHVVAPSVRIRPSGAVEFAIGRPVIYFSRGGRPTPTPPQPTELTDRPRWRRRPLLHLAHLYAAAVAP